jgi:hypothetical protein
MQCDHIQYDNTAVYAINSMDTRKERMRDVRVSRGGDYKECLLGCAAAWLF